MLLFLLILGRAWVLFLRWNVPLGFDVHPHLEMLSLIRWFDVEPPVRAYFYSYHPPIVFLLQKLPMLLGCPPVASVQIVSTIASLAAFLGLRSTLAHLKLLSSPAAIAFLYITSSLPIQIFLASSVNMDVVTLALAALTLSASVALFSPEHRRMDGWKILEIIVLLAIGLLSKFSAILLLPIPALVALTFSPRRQWRCRAALAATAVAVLLVSPFYLLRYYVPEGTLFPSNTDVVDRQGQTEARQSRDAEPGTFVLSLFHAAPAHEQDPALRDLDHPRLSDTWKDLWIMDRWLGEQPSLSHRISLAEAGAAAILTILGLFAFLVGRDDRRFRRCGFLLLSISLIHVLFLILYTWRNPWGGGLPTKAIYIAPAVWGVGYLVVNGMSLCLPSLQRTPARVALLMAVAAFMIINHAVPVY